VNVYSTNPPQPDTLVDDRLEIHVHNGAWQWYQRGGSAEYNGLTNGVGMVVGENGGGNHGEEK
jgi:hypothetical protein